MADGAIKIITKIETGGFEKGKKRLKKGLAQLPNSMKNLEKTTSGVDKLQARHLNQPASKPRTLKLLLPKSNGK